MRDAPFLQFVSDLASRVSRISDFSHLLCSGVVILKGGEQKCAHVSAGFGCLCAHGRGYEV